MRPVTRREFLGVAAAGSLTVAGLTVVAVGRDSAVAGTVGTRPTKLTIGSTTTTMVDGTRIPAWSYSPGAGIGVPGPVLWAVQGEVVELTVSNELTSARGFAIPGVVDSGPIRPGGSATVRFIAPAAGSYLYLDPVGAPIGRMMGLQGAFLVMPATGFSPYTTPTPALSNLFSDLGDPTQLGGKQWIPDRQWIWLFNQVDPALAQRVASGATVTPAEFTSQFAPRYFTINGKSGFFAA